MTLENDVINMLCSAISHEEKEKNFYEKAAQESSSELGKEIFLMLKEEEEGHLKGFEEIYESLKNERGWPVSCALLTPAAKDLKEAFEKKTSIYFESVKKTRTAPEVLQVAINLEKASIKFYEDYLGKVQNKEAKELLGNMIREENGHFLALVEMQNYYDDPEGYFMDKEHRGLDGA